MVMPGEDRFYLAGLFHRPPEPCRVERGVAAFALRIEPPVGEHDYRARRRRDRLARPGEFLLAEMAAVPGRESSAEGPPVGVVTVIERQKRD